MGPYRRVLRNFRDDTRGAIFIQMVVFFLCLMGMAGLVLDVGRIYVINTSAQAYVDEIALAAATELDGMPGARQRARIAAFGEALDDDPHVNNALRKMVPFGEDDDLFGVTELIFVKQLFTDTGYQYNVEDLIGVDGSNLATTDEEAEYVIAMTETAGIATTLLRLARWGSTNKTDALRVPNGFITRAVAVAGLEDGGICDTPMFMFCNPLENDGDDTTPDNLGELTDVRGRMLLLKNHGQKIGSADTSWAPGDYGTVDLPLAEACVKKGGIPECDPDDPACDDDGGNSSAMQRCLLAVNSLATRCKSSQTVDMDPGQSISIHTGLNLRFGIYDSQTKKYRDDDVQDLFSPDVNVVTGTDLKSSKGASACYSKDFEQWTDPNIGSDHLPRADCINNNTCSPSRLSPAMPSTAADLTLLENYWYKNYGDEGISFETAASEAALIDANPFFPVHSENDAGEDVTTPGALQLDTRYDMYLYEIYSEHDLLNDVGTEYDPATGTYSSMKGSNKAEYANAAGKDYYCADPAVALTNRRVFMIASVNCQDPDGDGDDKDAVAGNSEGVEVADYFYAFLTEPVKDNDGVNSEDDIYLELIRKISADQDPALIHSYPVLHR